MKMKRNGTNLGLAFFSLVILGFGYVVLWFFFPSILNRFGGFNVTSLSLTLFLALLILVPSIYIFRHAQGKTFGKWQSIVPLTYIFFAIDIALAFSYDMLLPPEIPVFWRLIILPLATIVITFYLLRRIPKIKEKIKEMSKDW